MSDTDAGIMLFETEKAWLDARHQRITASDCAVIMGSPKHREWAQRDNPGVDPVIALWRSKTQPREHRQPNIVMRMGTALEQLAADLYAEASPQMVVSHPYRDEAVQKWAERAAIKQHDGKQPRGVAEVEALLEMLRRGEGLPCYGFHTRGSKGWAAASLDRVAVATGSGLTRIVECKSGMYGRGNFAATYCWPAQWQMYVADEPIVDFACIQKAKAEFWVERVERQSQAAEDKMVMRCAEFNTYVQRREEPPMDWIYEPEF